MQLSSQGVVVALERITIHGQPNFAIRFRLDGSANVQEARLAAESVRGNPGAGDRIVVKLVLGEAFEVRKA